MKLQGLAAGTRLVTVSGDIAELLEVSKDGGMARVRYVEVLPSGAASVNTQVSLPADDIVTVDGNRFVGAPQTASTSRQ